MPNSSKQTHVALELGHQKRRASKTTANGQFWFIFCAVIASLAEALNVGNSRLLAAGDFYDASYVIRPKAEVGHFQIGS